MFYKKPFEVVEVVLLVGGWGVGDSMRRQVEVTTVSVPLPAETDASFVTRFNWNKKWVEQSEGSQ